MFENLIIKAGWYLWTIFFLAEIPVLIYGIKFLKNFDTSFLGPGKGVLCKGVGGVAASAVYTIALGRSVFQKLIEKDYSGLGLIFICWAIVLILCVGFIAIAKWQSRLKKNYELRNLLP
jgi:hypothetical protein